MSLEKGPEKWTVGKATCIYVIYIINNLNLKINIVSNMCRTQVIIIKVVKACAHRRPHGKGTAEVWAVGIG